MRREKKSRRIIKKAGPRGFSTIEVIFALFLLATALVVYASSLNLVRILKTTRYQNLAYHIAQKQLEDMRNTAFSALPGTGAISDSQLSSLPSGQGTLTVTDLDTNLKQVTVSVSWTETGLPKSVNLDTLIYQNGINSL